jgi:acyl-coenzyme A synthetase/AMP-(fatty) acid ligase
MGETLSDLFDQTALQLGEKEAILFIKKGKIESRITYSSLKRVSERVANGLKGMGLEKGDRVVLCVPKSIEAVVIHLGVQKAGGISVILNPGFKKDEMAYFLEDTDAKIIVVGKKEEDFIRSLDPKRWILCVDTESPFSEEKLFPSSPPTGIPSPGKPP